MLHSAENLGSSKKSSTLDQSSAYRASGSGMVIVILLAGVGTRERVSESGRHPKARESCTTTDPDWIFCDNLSSLWRGPPSYGFWVSEA
ncbi:hypothetical protein BDZ94DRAFT_1269341 [Collybia nuda]|uniref:Uncharacterized protein n=1 Tax=Collybia nuda TaxID=64659 RepID=A0A9P5Y0C0_9AGAR|nr:hypothetical protein BDZ94DRAFT_1269341 [Collybia nuda]